MTLQYPDLDSVKKEIESEVNAYIHAITTLSSLREHLESMNIKCYIEMKIEKRKGNYKTPDLLICSDNYIVVDHKYTESKNEKTLTNKLKEMKEYDHVFIFHDARSKKENEFKPEIVMLTPEEIVKYFKEQLNCPITWGYRLNEEITINQSIGSVRDSKIASLFTPMLVCPKAEEISKYKFIISHPPLPYTACQIYTVLWTLSPPTEFFTPEFEVKYDDILSVFNNLFPPWVHSEIRQLNVKRLSAALLFLQKIGWIRWFETERIIIVDRRKGRLIADLLAFLIDHRVKIEHEKRVKDYEKKLKELEVTEKTKQTKIIKFIK